VKIKAKQGESSAFLLAVLLLPLGNSCFHTPQPWIFKMRHNLNPLNKNNSFYFKITIFFKEELNMKA